RRRVEPHRLVVVHAPRSRADVALRPRLRPRRPTAAPRPRRPSSVAPRRCRLPTTGRPPARCRRWASRSQPRPAPASVARRRAASDHSHYWPGRGRPRRNRRPAGYYPDVGRIALIALVLAGLAAPPGLAGSAPKWTAKGAITKLNKRAITVEGKSCRITSDSPKPAIH